MHADGSVSVADDGRGLPVDSDPVNGKNGIVKTLGTARAGGKFSAHADASSTGAGLNGIGAAAAVFISARTDVTVRRAGKTYLQSFGGGYPGVFDGKGFDPDAPFTRADTQKLRGAGNRKPDAHGTTVRILFDPAVVRDSSVDINEVLLRAHAAARMSPGVHLIVIDEGWPGEEVRPELLEPFSGPWGTDTLLDLYVRRRQHSRARRARRGGGPRGVHHRPRPDPVPLVLDGRPRRAGHGRRVLQYRAHPRWRISIPTAAVKGLSEALADRASRIRDLGLAKGEDGPEAQDFAAVTALAVDTRAPDVAWDSQAKTAVSSRSLNVAMALDVARSVTIWAANPGNADAVSLWTKLALESARARRSAEGAKARSRAASKAKGLGTNLSLPPSCYPAGRPDVGRAPSCSCARAIQLWARSRRRATPPSRRPSR